MSKEKPVDKLEEQRGSLDKELKDLQAYAARMSAACLMRALTPRDGIDWAQLAKAASFAGGVDALRAAMDVNDGNKTLYKDPF